MASEAASSARGCYGTLLTALGTKDKDLGGSRVCTASYSGSSGLRSLKGQRGRGQEAKVRDGLPGVI